MNPITLRCTVLALIIVTTPTLSPADDETQLSLQQIYDNFKAAYTDGNWETARDWAGQLIEAKELEYGADAPELIVSLINRAAVDLEVKDWESAQENTQRGLAILAEQPQDNQQQHMALLLTSAKAKLGLRDEKKARDTLYEALRLNKKHKPADKWTEADIYQLLVEVAKREFAHRDGNQATKNSLKARTKFFGDNRVQMATYHEEAARWYRWSSQYGEERKQHKQAIELLEAHYGKENVRLATPLMGVAETYMIPHKSPKKIETALHRAQALNYPDSAEATFIQARVLTNLADYHIVFDDPDRGIALYDEAWHLMANHAEMGAAVANQYFSATHRLYFNTPDKPASTGKGSDYFTEGFVLLGFGVSRSGRLEDIKVLESKPVQMREKLFIDAARKARYRPRIVDGEPVVTPDESFRLTYDWTYR